MRTCWATLILLTACGGGGGGDAAPPQAAAPLTFELAPVTIGAAEPFATITFACAQLPTPGPALLEVQFRLPPELELPAADRLTPAATLAALDGDTVGDRFVVLCGDTSDPAAQPLPTGPQFSLRVQPKAPRQPGSYQVDVLLVQAATAAGAEVPVGTPVPATVTVTVE